jgi:primosomal protein N'
VILLDCERIFNQPSLRAEEEAKHLWFDLIARVKNDGDVFISLQNNHPVTQQLLRRKNFNENDLNQRLESKLPPYYRCVVVKGSNKEISIFADNLRSQGRFLVSGPIEITAQISYIVIRFDYSEGSILVELLDDIVKVQGVKGRDIFDVRFDPYEL